jgi:CRP-like cAMP-binding protein
MFKLENYLLKSSSFYDMLNVQEKTMIKNKQVRQEFKKDQVLFKEGSYSKGIYIVKKGKVKIFKSNQEGRESIVYIYKKGDFFGYRPLLGDDPHPVSAAAIDNVVITFLPKDDFLYLFERSETLAKKIILTVSHEFTVWINKMTVFTQYSVKERVALSLLILDKVYQKEENKRSVISINRNDFANFVGTATESLVRMLRTFKDEKVIYSNNAKITVLKPLELHEYS